MTAGALPFVVGAGTVAVGTAVAAASVVLAARGVAFVRDEDKKYEDGKYENGDYTNTAKIGMVIQDGIDLFNKGVNSIKTFATGIVNGETDRLQASKIEEEEKEKEKETPAKAGSSGLEQTCAFLGGAGIPAGVAGIKMSKEDKNGDEEWTENAGIGGVLAGSVLSAVCKNAGSTRTGAIFGTVVAVGVYLNEENKKLREKLEKVKSGETQTQPTTSPTTEQTASPEPTPTPSPEVTPEPVPGD